MQRIKNLLTKIFVTGLLIFAVASPVVYAAPANTDATCEGAQIAGASVDCTDGELSDDQFGNLVRTVINILSVIVGAVSVIMIIIGGFRYVVSNGDANATKGAKDTILYAIIGLVIVLFAQIIVRFVVTEASPEEAETESRASSVVAVINK